MSMSDPHEFREDVNDYSMCTCGIPAITHDAVMLKASIAPPSSPVETTGGDSGTSERRWDLDAPYATWDLLDLIAYIDHWRDQCATLTAEVERLTAEKAAMKVSIFELAADLGTKS
jgi:hypothetical protein